jgi:hypothetical protein
MPFPRMIGSLSSLGTYCLTGRKLTVTELLAVPDALLCLRYPLTAFLLPLLNVPDRFSLSSVLPLRWAGIFYIRPFSLITLLVTSHAGHTVNNHHQRWWFEWRGPKFGKFSVGRTRDLKYLPLFAKFRSIYNSCRN